MLRPGNAGSNTAAERIEVTRLALTQLPRRLGRRVLIRTDSGGGTHEFLAWLASPGRRLHYSVGMTITDDIAGAILTLPEGVWEPAYDAGGQVRPGAWVAELTGLADLSGWPEGMRVIVRKERPHPGAQLRFTDLGGRRFTCFAPGTRRGCASPRPGPGPLSSLQRSPACSPSHPADQHQPSLRPGRTTPGPVKPVTRQPGSQSRPHAKTANGRSLNRTDQDRETSRLRPLLVVSRTRGRVSPTPPKKAGVSVNRRSHYRV